MDLLIAFEKHAGDPRIPGSRHGHGARSWGTGNKMPRSLLPKLAQFEITLLDWAKDNLGASKYVAFANKCWPAFEAKFGFVPCYVNSRLTAMGIPVACEVDIYGALSEYIGTCVTGAPVTLLDINNTVPADMYKAEIDKKTVYNTARKSSWASTAATPPSAA